MDWRGDPHPVMEEPDTEIRVVEAVLRELREDDLLPEGDYDRRLFDAHRQAVRERFEIPWTGISPRMQRLLYAVNAIREPAVMVAAGVFCGNTFISNAGAAIGPGACYSAKRLVGLEIRPREADRARRNISTVDPGGEAEILGADAVDWIRGFDGTIDLLYIDADGSYLRIIEEAARRSLVSGSVILAHNSVNLAGELREYLAFVRDPAHSVGSVNICIDDQGLEYTLWK